MTGHRLAVFVAISCLGGWGFGQNQAASFDGNGTGWGQVPDHPSLVPATGLTIEAWVYRSSTNSGGYRCVVRKNASSFNESYSLRLNSGQPQMVLKTAANGTTGPTAPVTLPTNTWHHLAATFDNSSVRIYMDGTQIVQQTGLTGPLVNTGSPLLFAAGDSEPWSGYIDNVRLWSVARTQQEIQFTMNYQISSAPNLVSSWHLNGNFQDSTGSNHGAAMGTVPFVPGAPLLGFLTAPAVLPVGAPLLFQINNPVGGLPYILDVSLSGSSPGVTIAPGMVIPLNPPWLNYETGASLSNLFVNFFGILNAAGHASPYVNVPQIPALAGTVVSATYVALNPTGPSLVSFISPATTTVLAGPAPVINTIAPPNGPTTGGTTITVTGGNFQAGATVQIGTTPATNVMVSSASSLTFTLPAGTLGPKPVTVTNPDLGATTLANGFTYVTPLTLTQVAPLVAAPGATIVVTGTGIQIGAALLVGGVAVTPLSSTSVQMTFANPASVPCGGPIQITNPNTQTASIAFNPSPAITTLFPSGGPAAGGNVVSVVGTNFAPGSTVSVNGNVVPSTYFGTTLVTVAMPASAPGPASVTVTSVNACSSVAAAYSYQ
jgi:Concanavalin A-like lectin/glucanases superfamily/IPT/TIG domain